MGLAAILKPKLFTHNMPRTTWYHFCQL